MDVIRELQNWYASQLNGEWEHSFGITIQSLDNPGWWIKVRLTDQQLSKNSFQPISRGTENSSDWMKCYIEGEFFHGVGDSQKLESILGEFLQWVKSH